MRSSSNDATVSFGQVLRLLPRFLRLHQQQQHPRQHQIVTRHLIAQTRDETKDVMIVGCVFEFFGVRGVSMVGGRVLSASHCCPSMWDNDYIDLKQVA